MMKEIVFLFLTLFLIACGNSGNKAESSERDSSKLEQKEMQKVDDMLKNQDSILKAKEKELMEQYR